MEKMRMNVLLPLAVLSILFIGFTNNASGKPSWATSNGNSCVFDCHSPTTGRMQVTNADTTVDLGTQLDGSVRGPLQTYQAAPGDTVTLSVHVINGSSKYAAQLKNLEKGGQSISLNNHLTWSQANGAGNIWTTQTSGGSPVYFTKDAGNNSGISWAGTPITYTYDLQINASTPADVYNLTLAVAGIPGTWYQEEHFYLDLTAGVCAYDLAGDLNDDCTVNLDDIAILVQNWLIDCDAIPTPSACVPL